MKNIYNKICVSIYEKTKISIILLISNNISDCDGSFSSGVIDYPNEINEAELMLEADSWWESEVAEKRAILEIFWNERIVNLNQKSVIVFKESIIKVSFPKHLESKEKMDKLFNDACSRNVGFETFLDALKDIPLNIFKNMEILEKWNISKASRRKKINPQIQAIDLVNMKRYMQDKKMTASVTFGSAEEPLITPNFTGNTQSSYAIHSVGKVFTGILVVLMIREGIISDNDLNQPVKLDESVVKALPFAVREQLKKVSLHQLMTHKAGLGNYLEGYFSAIRKAKNSKMNNPEDFLKFAENNVFPIGEYKYSNLGILLVGLAVRHAYEKKYGFCDYNSILQKYIINEVGMPSFTPWKPENAKYNKDDPVAPHIDGSPAGGYWVTTEDLAKFGQWIYRQVKSDAEFEQLLGKYGQEFYNAEKRVVAHSGRIPSSSAYFSVSLKTGALVAILSDQPIMASELNAMIQKHIFSEPSKVTGEIDIENNL